MSLFLKKSRVFSILPRIKETNRVLSISNSFTQRLLTLFMHLQKVEIDWGRSRITIRTLWFLIRPTKVTIPFKDISHLDYDYEEFGRTFGFTPDGIGKHDSSEEYSVKVVTKNKKSHTICKFRGKNATMNGALGVILGDSLVDYAGVQEETSRAFVLQLCNRLGVSLGKDFAEPGMMRTCTQCGSTVSGFNPKCLYCGAIDPIDDQPH